MSLHARMKSGALQYITLNGSNPAFVALKYITSYGNITFLNNNFQIVFRRRMQFALSTAYGGLGQSIDMKLKEQQDFYPVVTIRFLGEIDRLKQIESTVWPDKLVNEMFMTWFNIINVGDKFWLEKIFDLAPAIQGEWPAKFKEQWINRTRHWPNADTVTKIASVFCHLVAKPQAQSVNKPLQWRFGFNIAENVLCSKFTPAQRQVLMLLKALRRKYLQSPKVLASYHLKTTICFDF